MRRLPLRKKRRLVTFMRFAVPAIDLVALISFTGLFIYFLPLEILQKGPATGGDTGSHFWTLYGLVEHGLPNGQVKVWNPGNQLGEPRLLHYFPLPFLFMAFVSKFLPLGMAFNIGTLFGTLLFPFAVYLCVRGLGLRFPLPIIAVAFAVVSHYNESYSMWGGNTLSTLAGQFAHSYALDLLLLAIGAFGWEIRTGRKPFFSALAISGVLLSHGYPALCFPVLALVLPLTLHFSRAPRRIIHSAFGFFWGLLLSLWFLIPMIDNRKWNTKLIISWNSGKLFDEIFPSNFYPIATVGSISALIVILFALFRRDTFRLRREFVIATLFFILTLYYAALYPILPHIGLIDIRSVPQIQLFATIFFGLSTGLLLQRLGHLPSILLTPMIIVGSIWWSASHSKDFPAWLKWNVSGWEVKPLYPAVKDLSAAIHGDFSDPRVSFELSDQANAAGTIRVWEMIPYFSGRATLESVYLEATLLAPISTYIQAEISKFPSCPFQQFKCVHYDLTRVVPHLQLTAVDTLILVNNETVGQARDSGVYDLIGTYGPWKVFRTKALPSYAEVISRPVQFLDTPSWQETFYNWFVDYDGHQPFFVARSTLTPELEEQLNDLNTYGADQSACKPEVEVTFNRLRLKTACPGKLHLLKFNYHPSWATDSGDQIFALSPGMIGIIPSQAEIELLFGYRSLWATANLISVLALIALFTSRAYGFFNKKIAPTLIS